MWSSILILDPENEFISGKGFLQEGIESVANIVHWF